MECARIPSARINCKSLQQIISNPCVHVVSEFPIEKLNTRSTEYIESVIKSVYARWNPEAHPAIKKWVSQICNPNLYMMFMCVSQWGSKSDYFFGQGYYHGTETEPPREICLYFGKSRIYSGRIVALLNRPGMKKAKEWVHLRGAPKWILWDSPEYIQYWPRIRSKKETQYLEENGSIRYWPTEGGIKLISVERQNEYKALDKAIKEIDKGYTFCMTDQELVNNKWRSRSE